MRASQQHRRLPRQTYVGDEGREVLKAVLTMVLLAVVFFGLWRFAPPAARFLGDLRIGLVAGDQIIPLTGGR